MDRRRIAIITTRLPPQTCGIGTYSWLVHQHWPLDKSAVEFLVIDGAAQSAAELGHAAISEFNGEAQKLSQALDRVRAANVFLHYAARAYHRYACPRWLAKVLRKWKAKFPTGHLSVFFHELPGDFPMTSRYFWIDACNRRVVRQLAALADAVVTNTAEHVRKIEEISGRGDAHLIPVGSNIEPPSHWSNGRTRSEFAVFGLPFGRWQTLRMFDREIRSWRQSGVLRRIHLVGPRDTKFDGRSDQLIAALPGDTVVRHGFLPSSDVSKILSQVGFGITNVTLENWTKSSVFMAYTGHGCAVVSKVRAEVEPLRFIVSPEEVPIISDAELTQRRRMLKEWYSENADWGAIARKISALLPSCMWREVAT